MTSVTHLKSLQALELAIREGSLTKAAARLGITPAAVGQRIRTLEDYLGTELLLRGRSGLKPTPELQLAIADLRTAFDALERATNTLDFQRVGEIHIVADPDWADQWLAPRLPAFRAEHPNILFCINGDGDVPLRIGSPDLRILLDDGQGTALFRDVLVPVTGPDNPRRLAAQDAEHMMEGMPLLHLKRQRDEKDYPGWVDWFDAFGHRARGTDRGIHYPQAKLALEAARQDVGFFLCGLSLVLRDLDKGTILLPFPISQNIPAPHPYRLSMRAGVENRPQVQRFINWLEAEAQQTRTRIEALLR
ncbi:LysR family transcriptional regulator [Sulfitobacter sp. JB4-11]|uniref:LysR family transcriptional regulator n=1 Tax=Sulfitobacter rhodophyticola TaxID=3238304 RepID=UPI0035195EBB